MAMSDSQFQRKRHCSNEKMRLARESPSSIEMFESLEADEVTEEDRYGFVALCWTSKSREKVSGLSQMISRQLVKSNSPAYAIDPLYVTSMQQNGRVAFWREKTVLWFLEVAECLELPTGFIETAVSILDRYLSKRSHDLQAFRVSAAAALYVAGKMFTQRFFSSGRLVQLCGDKFSVEDLLSMEKLMLVTLKWATIPSTAVQLSMDIIEICSFVSIAKMEEKVIRERVARILEISLSDHRMLQFPILSRAWAAILCAVKIQYGETRTSKNKRSYALMASLTMPDEFVQWRNLFNHATSIPDEFIQPDDSSVLKCEARMTFLWQRCMA